MIAHSSDIHTDATDSDSDSPYDGQANADACVDSEKNEQESHAVAGKPRDAAVNSDRYQQPVGQNQSE